MARKTCHLAAIVGWDDGYHHKNSRAEIVPAALPAVDGCNDAGDRRTVEYSGSGNRL